MELSRLTGFFDELQKLASKPPVSGVSSTSSEAWKTMSTAVPRVKTPKAPKLNVPSKAGTPGKLKNLAKVRPNAPDIVSPNMGSNLREMPPPPVTVNF